MPKHGLFLISLLLTACGPSKVDSELRPYVDEFFQEAARRGINDVGFSGDVKLVDHVESPSPEAPRAGRCVRRPLLKDDIEVKRSTWENSSEIVRKVILFHELGHCALGRGHLDGSVPATLTRVSHPEVHDFAVFPKSIMAGRVRAYVYESWVEPFWDLYLDELFQSTEISIDTLVSPDYFAQGPEVYEAFLSEWRGRFQSAVDRMAETSRSFGKEFHETPLYDFRVQIWVEQLVLQGYPDPASDLTIEAFVYSRMAPHVCYRTDDSLQILEVDDGRRIALSLMSPLSSSSLEDFLAHYAEHRQEYLNEFFTGHFVKELPPGTPHVCIEPPSVIVH